MGRTPEVESISDRHFRRYDSILRRIAGDNYKERFIDFLRQQGFIPNGNIPQMLLPLAHHEGSRARYLYDYPNGDDQILVQILGPGQITSKHYHESPIIERYLPFIGTFHINDVVVPPRGQIILPGFVHQGKSSEHGWSATVIVMGNVKGIPQDQWHIKV